MRTAWALLIGSVALLATSGAWALPQTTSAVGSDRDATLTLTTWDKVIIGDTRSRCALRLVVGSAEIAFTDGDTIQVKVYEDDVLGDDVIWQQEIVVSGAEVRAGRLDRTFDCSSNFGADQIGQIEIFGEATIVKDECGFLCTYEAPQTGLIALEEIADDASEPDDTLQAATEIDEGERAGLVSADEDWLELSFNLGAVDLRLLVAHLPAFGRLDVTLLDAAQRRVADAADVDGGALLTASSLAPGRYFVKIAPRSRGDFNFYDTDLLVDLASDACTPGDEETLPCGDCGSTRRLCNNGGRWEPFDSCAGEGECTPGDERVTVCGDCGSAPEVCGLGCAWESAGQCTGEGECSRGETDRLPCRDGFEFRICDNACQWGEFGACVGEECGEGEVRDCYEGEEGSEGRGVCHGGRQVCDQGRFGACVGQVVPFTERCGDGQDNDCDGDADEDDGDCADQGAGVGSACRLSSECQGELVCLINQFTNGYCSLEGCASDGDCGPQGVCGEAFGQRLCLHACQSDANCRTSYLCAEVGAASDACLPRCTDDEGCPDPANPFCDLARGLCADTPTEPAEPEGAPEGGPEGEPEGQPEPDPGFVNAPPPADEGCAALDAPLGGAAPALLAVLLGLALIRRRRP